MRCTDEDIETEKGLDAIENGVSSLPFMPIYRTLARWMSRILQSQVTVSRQHQKMKGDHMTPVLTIGALCRATGQPPHKVRYALQSRQIQPIARAGRTRLYDDRAAERLRSALAEIESRAAGAAK